MDYAQLFPNLLVGSHPKSTDDIDRLRAEFGITAVVNLQTDEDMRSRNIPWGLLEPHYRACGILLCRVPVRDEVASLREKLPECVRALARLLDARQVVYLHCSFGAGRSPTVAIAYLQMGRTYLSKLHSPRPLHPRPLFLFVATRNRLLATHIQ